MRENQGEVMHKEYTAKKMREMESVVASGDIGPFTRETVALMLRQASEMLEQKATAEKTSSVGNAAAMREALNMIKDEAVRLSKIYTAPMVHITSLVCDALSTRSRNCDVGTPKEQSARFDAHCRKHMGCLTCPLREKDGGVPKHCEFAWSQMPYEEDENGKESDVKE